MKSHLNVEPGCRGAGRTGSPVRLVGSQALPCVFVKGAWHTRGRRWQLSLRREGPTGWGLPGAAAGHQLGIGRAQLSALVQGDRAACLHEESYGNLF